MKSEENRPIINHIENMNLEIDYDKLADAIVKAERQTKEKERIQEEKSEKISKKKIGFWKSAWKIIADKNSENQQMVMNSLVLVSKILYFILFIFCLLLLFGAMLLLLCFIIKSLIQGTLNYLYQILISGLTVTMSFLFGLIFKGAYNDIEKETDKNYIASVFSGVVSFVALIVALIALLKGVQ